jgi:hypothetical protein
MNTDPLLRTPLAIEEYINKNFPDLSVQIDGEREIINITIPHTLELPNGAQVSISTLVIRDILSDVINEIFRCRLSPQEANRALATCSPLSKWDEARSALRDRLVRRHSEQNGSSSTCSWWSIAARHITQALAPVWRDIAHITTIGGPYPPNIQTVLVALSAIAAAGACIGNVFYAMCEFSPLSPGCDVIKGS